MLMIGSLLSLYMMGTCLPQSVVPGGPQVQVGSEDAIHELAAIIPEKPTFVDGNDPTSETARSLIGKVGATRRLDGALLLVRALAFNFMPLDNERRGIIEMMPAARALKDYYGVDAAPLLLYEGARTEKDWLQARIAFVLRDLVSEAELKDIESRFQLAASESPSARQFSHFLRANQLDLGFDMPLRDAGWNAEELARIESMKRQQQRVGDTGFVNYVLSNEPGMGPSPGAGGIVELRCSASIVKQAGFSPLENKMLSFRLGAGEVGKGIEEAIAGMRVGGRRKVRIREEVAQGIREAWQGLPPESQIDVVFELVKVEATPKPEN